MQIPTENRKSGESKQNLDDRTTETMTKTKRSRYWIHISKPRHVRCAVAKWRGNDLSLGHHFDLFLTLNTQSLEDIDISLSETKAVDEQKKHE